jgi:hypothetical protein
MNHTLFLKSMQELSNIAKDTSVSRLLRLEALQVLHKREAWLYSRHLYLDKGQVSKYQVPDL